MPNYFVCMWRNVGDKSCGTRGQSPRVPAAATWGATSTKWSGQSCPMGQEVSDHLIAYSLDDNFTAHLHFLHQISLTCFKADGWSDCSLLTCQTSFW